MTSSQWSLCAVLKEQINAAIQSQGKHPPWLSKHEWIFFWDWHLEATLFSSSEG